MNEKEYKALAEMSTGWYVTSPFPVHPEQLAIIGQAVKTIRQGFMDYVTVEIPAFRGEIDFIQTAAAEPGYRVELKLTNEYTKMFSCNVDTVEEVMDLFRSVLVDGITPDLSGWEDITEWVFAPHPEWDDDTEDETPLWSVQLQ